VLVAEQQADRSTNSVVPRHFVRSLTQEQFRMTSTLPDTDIHPRLDTPQLHTRLCPTRNQWTPTQLRDLTHHLTTEYGDPLREITRYVPEQRWWTRLGLTHGVEIWLLSWLPGQHTAPHDHGGATGSFTVLTGQLTEQYRYPRKPIRLARRTTGTTIGFSAGRAHQVRNDHTTPAASVHAYSPPLVPTREYPSLHDIPDHIPPLRPHQLPLAELRALADVQGP
jgi:quercetin dioxygenase-like cupin family protein